MKGRRITGDREAARTFYQTAAPGDYMGPIVGFTGDKPAVFFVLPNGGIGHVCSPPHRFRECPDGSLEIRNSILHTRGDGVQWHGYLDEGHEWREC